MRIVTLPNVQTLALLPSHFHIYLFIILFAIKNSFSDNFKPLSPGLKRRYSCVPDGLLFPLVESVKTIRKKCLPPRRSRRRFTNTVTLTQLFRQIFLLRMLFLYFFFYVVVECGRVKIYNVCRGIRAVCQRATAVPRNRCRKETASHIKLYVRIA